VEATGKKLGKEQAREVALVVKSLIMHVVVVSYHIEKASIGVRHSSVSRRTFARAL
jgi:hypothetical protein